MPWFHVCISHWIGTTTRSEVKLDLTEDDLGQRIVEPYVDGRPITINGKSIQPDKIERVRITRTDQDSTHLRPTAEAHAATSPFRTVGGVDYHIANNMGTDVSDEFITGPPRPDPNSGSSLATHPAPTKESRTVFVIHGRNTLARDALFQFLGSIDLHPLEWSEVVQSTGKTAPYVGEILNAAFSQAHAVVVLLTPDDEARLRRQFQAENDPPHETQLTGQARPNVLFEAGMAMGSSEGRTILVELGDLRPFSDVAGRHAIRINNTTARRQELAQRLRSAGCPVNLEGTAWHSAGDFEGALAVLEPEETDASTSHEWEPANDSPPVSEDAMELLRAASVDREGMVLFVSTMGGKTIQTNDRNFAERGNRRSEARWEQALLELVRYGLIGDPTGKGEVYEVTHLGYQNADIPTGRDPYNDNEKAP